MIVAGVGMAWIGLLLAAAGVVLSVIEFKELRRLNPWLLPEGAGAGESPLLAPQPMRIVRVSSVVTILSAAVAVGGRAGDRRPARRPPARGHRGPRDARVQRAAAPRARLTRPAPPAGQAPRA